MKAILMTTRMLALAGAMSMSTVALAADAPKDSDHHPADQAQTAAPSTASMDRSKAMRERMTEIRASKDPDKRKQLMEAQMKDMEAMMADGSCPMMAGGKPGMMGGGMMGGGMMGGMMGGGMGKAGQDDMMAKRMEMMEKRMDMMQMMMQQNMGSMMKPAK